MRMQHSRQSVLWVAGTIGGLLGLIGGWSASPSFLFIPIRQDSPFYSTAEDAALGAHAVAFIGHAGINLLHFLMWVGGGAAVAVIAAGYVGSLIAHMRA